MMNRNATTTKDNANPVVRSVDPTNSSMANRRKQLLGWSELARISAQDPFVDDNYVYHDDDNDDALMGWEEDEDVWDEQMNDTTYYNNNNKSPEERAILQALMDTAAATDGLGVSVLRNVGIVIPVMKEDTSPPQPSQPPSHYLPLSFFRPQRQGKYPAIS